MRCSCWMVKHLFVGGSDACPYLCVNCQTHIISMYMAIHVCLSACLHHDKVEIARHDLLSLSSKESSKNWRPTDTFLKLCLFGSQNPMNESIFIFEKQIYRKDFQMNIFCHSELFIRTPNWSAVSETPTKFLKCGAPLRVTIGTHETKKKEATRTKRSD